MNYQQIEAINAAVAAFAPTQLGRWQSIVTLWTMYKAMRSPPVQPQSGPPGTPPR